MTSIQAIVCQIESQAIAGACLMPLLECLGPSPAIPALLQPDRLHVLHCTVLLLAKRLVGCHILSPLPKGLACRLMAEPHDSTHQRLLDMLASPDVYQPTLPSVC